MQTMIAHFEKFVLKSIESVYENDIYKFAVLTVSANQISVSWNQTQHWQANSTLRVEKRRLRQ